MKSLALDSLWSMHRKTNKKASVKCTSNDTDKSYKETKIGNVAGNDGEGGGLGA